VNYYRMFHDVEHPTLATAGSACIDIRAYQPEESISIQRVHPGGCFSIDPGQRCLISTGLKLDIPESFSVRIHPRSGLAIKHGITLVNAEGVIDSDYVEELKVPIINLSDVPYIIKHGERICQAELVFSPSVEPTEIAAPPAPRTNRAGGFGSTGKH
jgi:dUTP pyrophosphatase